MNCNELRDHYELYTIGLAEDPERSEIRVHLNRECEVCMEGMRRARETAALVGTTATPAAPSAKLRRRILASAGYEQQRGFGWAPALAGALAFSLIACVYFAGRQRDVARELDRVTGISRQQNIDLTRLNEAFSIINGADTRVSARVLLHVDELERAPDARRRRPDHRLGAAGEGHDAAVVGLVARAVEDSDAVDLADGRDDLVDDLLATTLAEVRDALDQTRHVPDPSGGERVLSGERAALIRSADGSSRHALPGRRSHR